jgi:WD40 repeat protein
MQSLTALDQAPRGAALLIDQCEEMFSLCENPDEHQEFLRALTAEAPNRAVGVALRSDHLADLANHTGFSRIVERGMYLIGGLDENGLRTAVEKPARQAGLMIEPGLVDLLVHEVRNDPGALPLMSHALQETWNRREGSTLTVAGYRATGGINGAVAQSAEGLYSQVEVEGRQRLRDLILRLVSPGPQGEPVRTRVPRRLVGTDPEHERLIEMLVSARLVTSGDGALEITHEALARAWPRLRGWLDDDVEGQRIRQHLSAAADAWDSLGRPDSELYRGVRLTRAFDWQSRTDSALTDTEHAFLVAAQSASEAEALRAAERARAQARLIRRLRIVLAGAAVLLVLAVVAGGIAAVQSNRAGRNAAEARDAAEASRRVAVSADARRVSARAELADDITLSLLLAAVGARLDDSPETRVNLLTALARRPHLVRSGAAGGGFLEVLSVSPDGRWVAASDEANRMHLYDAATNRLLRSYDAGRPDEDEPAWMIGAFSPDSRQLAVVLESVASTEPVRLLDPDTMQPTATRLAPPGRRPVTGFDVQFSADGRYLAATLLTVAQQGRAPLEAPGYAVVWDLRFPSTPPMRIPTGTSTDYQGLALSPDGRILYTGWPLTAYDVRSGDRIWREPDLRAAYPALDVNAAGTLLALGPVASGVNDGLLVDVEDGHTVATLRGHESGVVGIRFSPDGTLVGSISKDGEVIVWDTATGRPRERWDTVDPWGVGFSPDNHLVYGGGGDSMLRTWDLSVQDTYLQQTTQVTGSEEFAQAELSPDGQRVAYGWLDDHDRGWVRFADTISGEQTSPVRFPVWEFASTNAAWHPGGGQYAGYSCDRNPCPAPGTVTVLDPATGQRLGEKQDVVAGDSDIWSLAYVDEGRQLLVGASDGRTHMVETETLRRRGKPMDVPGECCATPIGDGSTAMVYESSADGQSWHWWVLDVGDREVLSAGDVDLTIFTSVASPDGSTVAAAGQTGEIVTMDVSTGDERRRSISAGADVLWLNYSDDGELLVSGAADGGVSLWDATTLELLGTVDPPNDGEAVPSGAQFIGDTHDVAVASYDGRVYRWETDLERAVDFACQMAGRSLTEEEWEELLPAQPYQSVCPDE